MWISSLLTADYFLFPRVSWLCTKRVRFMCSSLTNLVCFCPQPSVWPRPPPRWAPCDQTHSRLLPVNVQSLPCQSSTKLRPLPTPHSGWREDMNNNITVQERVETNDWLINPRFERKEWNFKNGPVFSRVFNMLSLINAVLLGKTNTYNTICFLFFCLLHVFKPDNKTTNVDQMCHILILLQHVQAQGFFFFCFCFCFFRPALKPDLPDVTTTPHISWRMCFFSVARSF